MSENLADYPVMVLGQPFTELPRDLYIPPEALEVFLESFEGPLDLLLYLIRKNSLDVLDIPMKELTRQYMDYVEVVRTTHLELAAEYLVMAAVLIEIKSRMLLPKTALAEAVEEEDPRLQLIRRLMEYEQMKSAALALDSLPQYGREYGGVEVWMDQSRKPMQPSVSVDDLVQAWSQVLSRLKLTAHHQILREELSVREHMAMILKRLQSVAFMSFLDLFGEIKTIPVAVVNFLAILELAKESLITLTQTEPYAPLYIGLRDS
jgi:segregation and condensation protein A